MTINADRIRDRGDSEEGRGLGSQLVRHRLKALVRQPLGSPLGSAGASPLGEHSQAARMGPFMS